MRSSGNPDRDYTSVFFFFLSGLNGGAFILQEPMLGGWTVADSEIGSACRDKILASILCSDRFGC